MEDMEENKSVLADKAEDVAEAGRGGDTIVAHMTRGEIAIPPDLLAEEEDMAAIKAIFDKYGVDINEFTVGHEANKINPETGQPEFFFKKIRKIISSVAPIAAAFIPGLQPLAALGIGAGAGLLGGGGIKSALLGGLSGYAGAGGFGNTAVGRGIDSLKAGIADTAFGRGVSDLYSGASGAFDKVGSGISDLYSGSSLQSGFNSGSDALKSIGIDTGSATANTAPTALGGGQSSYSNAGDLKPGFLGTADFGSAATAPTSTALNTASTGANAVGSSSSNYASPLLSALLGTRANDKAEKALLSQQQANQQLLAPYSNGFSFTPGDLTQDPGYQANLDSGTKAAERAQLARGGYFSGEAAKELTKFSQGLADNTYNAAFNRALQARQAGLTGALAGAGVNENIGNIRANAATNQNNLYSGTLGAIMGGPSFTNTGALQGGFDIQDFLRRNGIGRSSYGSAA